MKIMKTNRFIPQRLRPFRGAALGLALLLLTAVPSASVASNAMRAGRSSTRLPPSG